MLHEKSEKILIEDCQKGDRKAQRQIYEHFYRKMFGVCLRYMKQIEEAEEMLTNGFLKVFKNIGQFKQEGSFEGWIRRIMVNECLTQLRKKQLLFVEIESKHLKHQPNFNEGEVNLGVDELMSCIEQLPDGYRTVFNLYAIEGYSHQEIAEMLSISEGTSKSQLSRARTLLQSYVKEMSEIQKGDNNGTTSYR